MFSQNLLTKRPTCPYADEGRATTRRGTGYHEARGRRGKLHRARDVHCIIQLIDHQQI